MRYVISVMVSVMMVPWSTYAQQSKVMLTWDYPVVEERNISRFLLQQDTNGQGYRDTGWGIDRSVRKFKVPELKRGDMVCFKMVALLERGDVSVKAEESNEICVRVSGGGGSRDEGNVRRER